MISKAESTAHQEGAGSGAFATTHWSLVLQAGDRASGNGLEALETLCRSYWPAIYAYVRRTGPSPESARDLTQGFFARLLQKDLIAIADPRKGRFRTFLLTVLQRFLRDQHDFQSAQKRGGGRELLSLDELVEEESRPGVAEAQRSPEQEFDRRWALATLDSALSRLRTEARSGGHDALFSSLQDHLAGGDPELTLADVAQQFQLGESAVKMRLSRWRARYRELIRQEVAQTVPSTADLDEEMRHLFAAVAS